MGVTQLHIDISAIVTDLARQLLNNLLWPHWQ